jgi:hypothetical protein
VLRQGRPPSISAVGCRGRAGSRRQWRGSGCRLSIGVASPGRRSDHQGGTGPHPGREVRARRKGGECLSAKRRPLAGGGTVAANRGRVAPMSWRRWVEGRGREAPARCRGGCRRRQAGRRRRGPPWRWRRAGEGQPVGGWRLGGGRPTAGGEGGPGGGERRCE